MAPCVQIPLFAWSLVLCATLSLWWWQEMGYSYKDIILISFGVFDTMAANAPGDGAVHCSNLFKDEPGAGTRLEGILGIVIRTQQC